MVYVGWLLFELIFVVMCVVETKGTSHLALYLAVANKPSGRTLEETAALFDGDQQQQDLVLMGGEAATMTMGQRNFLQQHSKHEEAQGEPHELRPRSSSSHSSMAVAI